MGRASTRKHPSYGQKALARLTTFIISIFACGLCLCSFSSLLAESKTKNFLRFNLGTEPPTLDPRLIQDTTSATALRMLYDGLVRRGLDDQIQPSIASSWTLSDDKKVYTFTLRAALWSNGDPLTAHDFEYTFKSILHPQLPAQFAYYLYPIAGAKDVSSCTSEDDVQAALSRIGVRALDDTTLEICLTEPMPHFLDVLARATFFPVHRPSAEKCENWAQEAETFVCNGPFRLQKWTHFNELILEKNPLYWDKDNVHLEGITTFLMAEQSTELYMFENAESDWAGGPVTQIPLSALRALKDTQAVKAAQVASCYGFLLNTNVPHLQNRKLRWALALSLNRRSLVDFVLQGGQEPATSTVPTICGLASEPHFQDASTEKAQALFAEALTEMGLTREGLKLRISYNTSEMHKAVAVCVQQQWKDVLGLEVELANAEWKAYLDQVQQGDFELARFSFQADYLDPINFLELFETGNQQNSGHYSNPDFDAKLASARSLCDEDRRLGILQEAERLLVHDMPVVPLFNDSLLYMSGQRVVNVYLSPLGEIDFKWARLRDQA